MCIRDRCACQSRFFQLQKLRPTVWSLTTTAAETLIYEFISCTVDYCNSLLCDVSDGLVLSYSRSRTPPSTSCLITGTRWWDHYKHLPVSSVLRSTSVALPSCPIEFKAAYLVCQSSGQATGYLADDIKGPFFCDELPTGHALYDVHTIVWWQQLYCIRSTCVKRLPSYWRPHQLQIVPAAAKTFLFGR